MLLQAIGFHLREFEKKDLTQDENEPSKEAIKVTIKCGTSKMKAVLEMDGIDCQCPNEAKGGSLWSICGHAPNSNVNNFFFVNFTKAFSLKKRMLVTKSEKLN